LGDRLGMRVPVFSMDEHCLFFHQLSWCQDM
jgi:hypothetical protein